MYAHRMGTRKGCEWCLCYLDHATVLGFNHILDKSGRVHLTLIYRTNDFWNIYTCAFCETWIFSDLRSLIFDSKVHLSWIDSATPFCVLPTPCCRTNQSNVLHQVGSWQITLCQRSHKDFISAKTYQIITIR